MTLRRSGSSHSRHVYPVTGKIRLRVQGSEDRDASDGSGPLEIQFGDEIQTLVRLRRPHIYQNPGSFDFRRWMEDIEDIYWVGTVKNPRLVEKVGHPAGFHFAEFAERARQRLLRGIDDLYPPWSAQGRYGAVLKAVLWGDRTALDSTTIDDFRKTGLYHLLVIAGLHVGLLTLLVEFLLRGLGCRRVTRSFIVLGFLVVYAFLVEQRAPTLRATLMIALYLVARILDRGHSPLNAIGGVALILLYLRPAWLFESGFQLSFAAALLIVGVAVPVLERTTEPYRRALRRLDDVLLDDHFSPRIAQARLDLRALIYALRRRVGFLRTLSCPLAQHGGRAPEAFGVGREYADFLRRPATGIAPADGGDFSSRDLCGRGIERLGDSGDDAASGARLADQFAERRVAGSGGLAGQGAEPGHGRSFLT